MEIGFQNSVFSTGGNGGEDVCWLLGEIVNIVLGKNYNTKLIGKNWRCIPIKW